MIGNQNNNAWTGRECQEREILKKELNRNSGTEKYNVWNIKFISEIEQQI